MEKRQEAGFSIDGQSGPTCILSGVQLSANPWSRLPFPPPGDLPHPGIELFCPLHLLHWQGDSLPLHHPGSAKWA